MNPRGGNFRDSWFCSDTLLMLCHKSHSNYNSSSNNHKKLAIHILFRAKKKTNILKMTDSLSTEGCISKGRILR